MRNVKSNRPGHKGGQESFPAAPFGFGTSNLEKVPNLLKDARRNVGVI